MSDGESEIKKIKLKNRVDSYVRVDAFSYQAILEDPKLNKVDFLDNLRAHSSGYAFFQYSRIEDSASIHETIYLHKYLAERFVPKPQSEKKLFVRFIDGDVLNACLNNLEWVTMNMLRRQTNFTNSSSGYRGVVSDRGRFRAVLYHEGSTFDLGFFDTPEEAGKAYNKKSIELFGNTNSLNQSLDPTDE